MNSALDTTDLDALDTRHVEVASSWGQCCQACIQLWPCTTHILVGEVRRLRAQSYTDHQAWVLMHQAYRDSEAEVQRLRARVSRTEAVLLWERHQARCWQWERHRARCWQCRRPVLSTPRCPEGERLLAVITAAEMTYTNVRVVGNVRFVAHPDNTPPSATPYDLILHPDPVVRTQALTEAEARDDG